MSILSFFKLILPYNLETQNKMNYYDSRFVDEGGGEGILRNLRLSTDPLPAVSTTIKQPHK